MCNRVYSSLSASCYLSRNKPGYAGLYKTEFRGQKMVTGRSEILYKIGAVILCIIVAVMSVVVMPVGILLLVAYATCYHDEVNPRGGGGITRSGNIIPNTSMSYAYKIYLEEQSKASKKGTIFGFLRGKK